jgi:hypothetical protein
MKDQFAITRREGLKLSAASILASLVPLAALTAARTASSRSDKEHTMAQASALAADKTAIRPFQVKFSEAELAELRKRINATQWPEAELVTDASQGVQLATMRKLTLLGHGVRLAQSRSEAECAAAIPDRDRRARHPFHSRSLET